MKNKIARIISKFPILKESATLNWHRPKELLQWTATHTPSNLEIIRPNYKANFPFPQNIKSFKDLPTTKNTSLSFQTIPNTPVDSAYRATLQNCWLIRTRPYPNVSEFTVCTYNGTPIKLHGLISDPNIPYLKEAYDRAIKGTYERIDNAQWGVGYWYNNYYHWLIEWLPRMVLGKADKAPILLPKINEKWALETIKKTHLKTKELKESTNAWHIKSLTISSHSKYHREELLAVRNLLAPPQNNLAKNKIWISRINASCRRLREEKAIQDWLNSHGWIIAQMEKLSLSEQIKLMQTAKTIGGIHGAGLTNILFAPTGTSVFEIGVKGRPNPDFYSLSSCLGHKHWYIEGNRLHTNKSIAHDDLEIDLDLVKKTVTEMEQEESHKLLK